MPQKQLTTYKGTEICTYYTGSVSSEFTPSSTGITYPSPSYKIYRNCSSVYVFEYVISGKGYVEQDDKQFTVQTGDTYILHAGKEQYYYSDEKDPLHKIWFNVKGSLVRHLLAGYKLDSTLHIPQFGQSQYLYDIFHTLTNNPINSSRELALLTHRHIQAIYEFCAALTDIPPQAVSMKTFIEQRLTKPLSIAEMADSVHLSRSHALHLFKEIYGITPYRYYMNQRLELAQSMLQHPLIPIQEISDQLGFSDYHHFSGFFKKECGMSPTQYRQQTKNKPANR